MTYEHYPVDGNKMLKASCGKVGMSVKKVTDKAKVTCPECRKVLTEKEVK